MKRFITAGLRDADARLGRITSPAPTEHPNISRVIAASAVCHAVDHVVGCIAAATRHSRLLGAAGDGVTRALGTAPAAMPGRIGMVLLVAVSTHLALTLWTGRPAGWYWLILPGITAAVGALLALASVSARRSA